MTFAIPSIYIPKVNLCWFKKDNALLHPIINCCITLLLLFEDQRILQDETVPRSATRPKWSGFERAHKLSCSSRNSAGISAAMQALCSNWRLLQRHLGAMNERSGDFKWFTFQMQNLHVWRIDYLKNQSVKEVEKEFLIENIFTKFLYQLLN